MNMIPYIVSWIVLALVVAVLAVYRLRVGAHEDITLHLEEGGGPASAVRVETSRRIRLIEVWGKALTIVGVLYGIILAGLYLYHLYVAGAQLPKVGPH